MNIPLKQEDMKAIGSRIREIQRGHKLRDRNMADLLGISVNAYRKIIYGSSMLSLSHLVSICKHLDVDYSLVIDGTERISNEILLNRILFYTKELQKRLGKEGTESIK